MRKIQALGIVRFSYAPISGFQLHHETVEDRLKYLFDPMRIEERFALFEHVLLPSIKAQTDPDFTLIIVTSQAIPPLYLERLERLIDGVPQIALVLKPPMHHRRVMRRIIHTYKDSNCDVIAQFKLDDDDGVAIDFVERARASFEKCAKVYDYAGKCALDFTQGVLLHVGNSRCVAEQAQFQQLSLVVYLPPKNKRTTIDYAHHRIQEFMPVITDNSTIMYVRSYNGFNDSPKARKHPMPSDITDPETVQILKDRFHISTLDLAEALVDLHNRTSE